MENKRKKEYNTLDFWIDKPIDYNLDNDVSDKTMYIFDWHVSPLPMGEYQSGLAMFDNIYEMIGFLKYKVLHGAMLFQLSHKTFIGFRMSVAGFFLNMDNLINEYGKNPWDESIPDFDELLSSDEKMDEYEKETTQYAKELIQILDEAFEQSESEAISTVERFINSYNRIFCNDERRWVFGINLYHNTTELDTFCNEELEEDDWMYGYIKEVVSIRVNRE